MNPYGDTVENNYDAQGHSSMPYSSAHHVSFVENNSSIIKQEMDDDYSGKRGREAEVHYGSGSRGGGGGGGRGRRENGGYGGSSMGLTINTRGLDGSG